jgi:hypothetical protein
MLWAIWQHLEQEGEELGRRAAQIRAGLERRNAPVPLSEQQKKGLESVRAEGEARAYRWDLVFDALEAAGGEGVRVKSFEHVRTEGRSQIEMVAASYDAIEGAVARLRKAAPQVIWSLRSVEAEQVPGAESVHAVVTGFWSSAQAVH